MEKKKESLQSNNVLKQNLLLQISSKSTKKLSKNQVTNQSGITLIALVVTIVVLLILAGITIALVFGQNGVIKKAQESKEETAIGEMRDKLEMAKVPVYADGNGSYKVEDYWDRIESEGLITDKEVDKIDNGDGTYEITTVPGYVFEITVEPNEEIADNIIIGECIGKGENLNIGLRVVNKTTNSIEIEVVRAEGASDFKYSIKKQGEEYGSPVENNNTTYTFSGLTQGGIYTIKVEATKDGEQQVVERTVQIGEIPKAIYGEVTWTGNGQAQARIYTNEEGYQLEWQKNGISEGSWTREDAGIKEKTITGLVNGDKIYARLYDGVSSGDFANVEVADMEEPNVVIKFNETTLETTDELTAEVTQTDEGSGVNITQTKWVFNTEAGEIGEEAASYTGGTFSKTPQTITLSTETAGTYYLHVLTIDNAGNKKEAISNPVTIKAREWDLSKVDKVESADGVTVPVPKGYVASGVASENTVKDGFVIYEGEESVTDTNVATARTTRNQFVWVPVANPNDIYGIDKDGKKWGKLYEFSESGISARNWSEKDGIFDPGSSSFSQEPVVNFQDSSYGIALKALEDEFNSMVNSIKVYGGFYIGRYETGSLSQTEAVVVKNNTDIGNQSWYTMYNKSKTIAANSNVTTTMIWGCQWDAVMRWMYNSGDSAKKTYTYDSTGKGNLNYAGGYSPVPTGSDVRYAVNNIFDMAGNVWEWCMTDCSTGSTTRLREKRGGDYTYRGDSYSTSSYYGEDVTNHTPKFGCRTVLLID